MLENMRTNLNHRSDELSKHKVSSVNFSSMSERFIKETNNEYSLIYEAKNALLPVKSRDELTIKCNKCGNIIKSNYQKFLNENKNRCKICNPIKASTKFNIIEFKNLVAEKGYEIINYGSDSELTCNSRTKILMKHIECGNEFERVTKDFYGKQAGCPICANKRRGQYLVRDNYLEDLLNNVEDGKEYKWLDSYNGNNKTYHKIKHLKCNTVYNVKPNDFQQGYKCPTCSKSFMVESNGVKYIKEIFNSKGIKYEIEYSDPRCKHIGILKFDFMVQLENNKKLLIEFDGQFHDPNVLYKLFSEEKADGFIIRDQIKDNFALEFNEEYVLERISHKDNIEEKMKEILHNYFNI